jgi:hypothetical protein
VSEIKNLDVRPLFLESMDITAAASLSFASALSAASDFYLRRGGASVDDAALAAHPQVQLILYASSSPSESRAVSARPEMNLHQ